VTCPLQLYKIEKPHEFVSRSFGEENKEINTYDIHELNLNAQIASETCKMGCNGPRTCSGCANTSMWKTNPRCIIAVPLKSQGSNENHLRQPCEKVGRLETLDEKRRRCSGGEI
jgi:hypothetical protein